MKAIVWDCIKRQHRDEGFDVEVSMGALRCHQIADNFPQLTKPKVQGPILFVEDDKNCVGFWLVGSPSEFLKLADEIKEEVNKFIQGEYEKEFDFDEAEAEGFPVEDRIFVGGKWSNVE